MSFFDFYNRIFKGRYGNNGRPPENEDDENFNPTPNPFWNHGNDMRGFPFMFDFKGMMDPFEINQLFEEKMHELMKSFMSPEMFPGIDGFGAFDSPYVRAQEEKQHPRDFYLKPGTGKSAPKENYDEIEVVPRSNGSGWLDSFLPSNPDVPPQSQPRTFSSFRSVIRKTVVLPDGTVKTEEIVRNSDGTEEKTESHSVLDGSSPPTYNFDFSTPDFSGLFGHQNWPGMKKNIPRDHFLKPGYEKLSPNSEKVDTDLDKQILQSGVESLPPFSEESKVVEPKPNFTFTKSFTKRTVTLPNGVVESEEVVHNSDGTEQRTVTQTYPDGTSSDPIRSTITDSYKNESMKDNQSSISLTLKGVKDLLDIIFK